ncbi:unnamed protein product [Fusarium equiseti]|uniref:Uncharacterized protein n=1 Tax=Fusarium equiseti TaxID=61235 RepID=A0A8J2N8S2_FUSEQ|nr:unnamed protein product [Fusarium equiseti]
MLKLPESVVESLRIKFGQSSKLDFTGPNIFILLQRANNKRATMGDSMECLADFANWNMTDNDEGYGVEVREAVDLGEGRIRPCVFDAEIVPYWREFCDEKHEVHQESPCSTPKRTIFGRPLGPGLVPGMRVIDVCKKPVVDYDFNCRQPYYALSYVWGAKPFLTLNTANEEDLRKEGSLSQAVLPDTIADAMEIVENMDGHHLPGSGYNNNSIMR